jgi:hypothetical protein
MPAPATIKRGEREARLVLDVLEADALGAPDEHGEGVGGVDDALDVEAGVLGLPGGVDEHREMVQQRPLGLCARASGAHLDECPPDLHAVVAPRAEAEVDPALDRRLGVRSAEGDVVEVVVDVRVRLDEPEPEPFGDVEVGLARPRLVELEPFGEPGERAAEVGDAQRDVLECPSFAHALRVEERQLAAARVRADERELVRPVDHVHAEVARDEVGDRVSVRDPEGNVVQRLRVHDADLTHRPRV